MQKLHTDMMQKLHTDMMHRATDRAAYTQAFQIDRDTHRAAFKLHIDMHTHVTNTHHTQSHG